MSTGLPADPFKLHDPFRRLTLFGDRFRVYSADELRAARRPISSVSDYGDFGRPQSLEAANKPCSTPAR